jgi:hypothetical protein
VLAAAGARVIDGEVALAHSHEAFDDDGALKDEGIRDQVRELLGLLVDEAVPERAAA